jgi:ABC-type nitrate/sulfonate/bicarbonate transport system substrate-binding protein
LIDYFVSPLEGSNPSMPHIKYLVGVIAALALQVCWCLFAFSAAPSKLIIGYAAMSARVVPLWIAEEQGILAKYGVDSEQVFIRGAPTLVAGLTSGDIHFGSTGGTATLAAIAAGHDLKMVAAFSSRNTYDLVTRPSIKRAEELRGKRFGVTSIGGTVWMGIMLRLEHFGLDEQRDKIQLQVIGDQSIQMQALEHGTIDAAVLDGVFSRRLKQKGFNITGEYSELKQLFTSQAIVVQGKFLQQRGDVVENLLKAQIEAIAFPWRRKTNRPSSRRSCAGSGSTRRPRKKATAISIAPWTANLIRRPKDCATCSA